MCEKESKLTKELSNALNAPGKLRLKIIKIIFPEIIKVAKTLRDFYWNN